MGASKRKLVLCRIKLLGCSSFFGFCATMRRKLGKCSVKESGHCCSTKDALLQQHEFSGEKSSWKIFMKMLLFKVDVMWYSHGGWQWILQQIVTTHMQVWLMLKLNEIKLELGQHHHLTKTSSNFWICVVSKLVSAPFEWRWHYKFHDVWAKSTTCSGALVFFMCIGKSYQFCSLHISVCYLTFLI